MNKERQRKDRERERKIEKEINTEQMRNNYVLTFSTDNCMIQHIGTTKL